MEDLNLLAVYIGNGRTDAKQRGLTQNCQGFFPSCCSFKLINALCPRLLLIVVVLCSYFCPCWQLCFFYNFFLYRNTSLLGFYGYQICFHSFLIVPYFHSLMFSFFFTFQNKYGMCKYWHDLFLLFTCTLWEEGSV